MSRKTCLLTGYPGFLGTRLYQQLGSEYDVHTLGLIDASTKHHIVTDLSRAVPELNDLQYDLVVHAAGKAHTVPLNRAEEESFFQVNEQGTRNLLAALNGLTAPPKTVVLISSVAVYGRETGDQITEESPLDATDAYGMSKVRAESALMNWDAPGVTKAVIRLPLIIGKNPPGNLGKMLAAIKKGTYFNIGGGKARRSFVWIDDIARFIDRLAVGPTGGIYNLTDGSDVSFNELYRAMARSLRKRKYPSLPYSMALLFAFLGDTFEHITHKRAPFSSHVLTKMTSTLTFSCDKAVRDFQWKPTNVLDRIEDAI